ncbi:MAG TPA: efflux transporter outer membrane subunit [Tepidisphaeraceae bacterium]|nr:efflux transporter outer membrane subunit [Tepidisphaeraceae bacterium]
MNNYRQPRDLGRSFKLATPHVLLCCALVHFGCAVGPNYKTPVQRMPTTWVAPPTTQASVTVQQPLQVERWWTTFNDPQLDSLVRRAVESNLDLQVATERVVEARASLGIVTSNLFPAVNASGSYSRSRGNPRDFFRAGFDAAWELDVFGGVRRGVEASNDTLQATIEDRRDVLVTLLGEVATDYISFRGFQQEIFIAQENLESQLKDVNLVEQKRLLGTGTDLDIAQAQAQVATTRSQIATLYSNQQQEVYALSVLLGQEPASLAGELANPQAIPTTPAVVPVGLPSELLQRRPDIRRSERQLAAATAEIGVAVADLFPKFSLTGTLSVQGNRFASLGNWNNRGWSFGPSFTWPVFDAWRIWSNVQVQNSVQRQSLLAYRSTILNALRDVEVALTAYAQEQQRRAALVEAVAANQRAVEVATKRYRQGLTDFLNVFVAQQSLFSSQDSLVQSDRNVATDLVALYKALGGGWEIGEPATTQPARHPF